MEAEQIRVLSQKSLQHADKNKCFMLYLMKCNFTHQLGIELLGWAAAVHGHESLCGGRHTAVVQVERTFSLWPQTVLWAAGEQGSMLGVNLERKHATYGHRTLGMWGQKTANCANNCAFNLSAEKHSNNSYLIIWAVKAASKFPL